MPARMADTNDVLSCAWRPGMSRARMLSVATDPAAEWGAAGRRGARAALDLLCAPAMDVMRPRQATTARHAARDNMRPLILVKSRGRRRPILLGRVAANAAGRRSIPHEE